MVSGDDVQVEALVNVEFSSWALESRRKTRWPLERRIRVSPRPMPRAAPVMRKFRGWRDILAGVNGAK